MNTLPGPLAAAVVPAAVVAETTTSTTSTAAVAGALSSAPSAAPVCSTGTQKFHSLALLCAVATGTLLGKRGKRSCEGADVHAQLALHWDFSFGAPITQFLISSLLRYYGQLCKVAVCVCERVFVCALELLVVGPTPCHTADWRTGLVYLNGYVCVCVQRQ